MSIRPFLSQNDFEALIFEVQDRLPYQVFCPRIGLLAEMGSINIDLNRAEVDAVAAEIESLPLEFEEIFHQNYSELDSGNIIDRAGLVTSILDRLATSSPQTPKSSFDKIALRRSDQLDLSDLHIDYFNSANGDFCRDRDRVFRYIFNLGQETRYTAVVPVPTNWLSGLPNAAEDRYLLDRVLTKIRQPLLIYLLPVPPIAWSLTTISYLRLDVFNLVHCAYGMKGDIAAIISSIE